MSSSLSSGNLLVVVVVAASVGACLLGVILLRVFRRIFRLHEFRPAPLPPIQPLAHHRERQLAQSGLASRTSVPYLTTPLAFGSSSGSGSHVSLLRGGFFSSSIPGTPSTNDARLDGVLDVQPETSSCSHSSAPRVASISTHHSSKTRSPRRPRSLSVVSMSGTNRTQHTNRGLPHGRYSNFQVVLPPPLSSFVHPVADRYGLHSRWHTTMDGVATGPLDDKWASLSVRTSSSAERRSFNFAQADHTRNSSRSRSTSFVASDISSIPVQQTPPVPLIPSVN